MPSEWVSIRLKPKAPCNQQAKQNNTSQRQSPSLSCRQPRSLNLIDSLFPCFEETLMAATGTKRGA